jgi:uncharacterized repeat protein (TIGR03803 family)
MKKLLLFILTISIACHTIHAQGVSRMFGLVGGSAQANQQSNGFLFSTGNYGEDLQVEYDFPVTTFGAEPINLEMAPYNGKLYGTTYRGGLFNYGTIFEYDPTTNIYTKKVDFNLGNNGYYPKGSLLLFNNKFYGLAEQGGVNNAGTIFEWDPATNVYTKKIDFNGTNGSRPQNSLKLMNGKMYGTTLIGGAVQGVVFEWDPTTNIYTKLLDLSGNGAGLNGRVFVNNVTPYNNKLYCMPSQGGTNDYGTILVIDPSLPIGSNTTIIRQLDFAGGFFPGNNEMIVYNNKLYGCLTRGGTADAGVLFEIDPITNTYTKLVNFSSVATGYSPVGKLVLNGTKFLGLCNSGGVNSTGTVFEWDPANPTTVVKKFDFLPSNYDNAVNPNGTFTLFNSKFYATSYDNSFVNYGALFEYDPSTSLFTKKKSFNAAENGRIPVGKPVLLNGKLYGTTSQGPQEIFGTQYGCLWEYNPSTAVYSRKFLFNNSNGIANGRFPVTGPTAYNDKLYGVTQNGGISDLGVFYELDPITDIYSKKDMQPIGGSFPFGEPAVYNNKLYGFTNANGLGNHGIVYSYDPATTMLSKLMDVQNGGSQTLSGAFTLYNNKLYGATSVGGANNLGGVFEFDPATNTATTPVSFSTAGGYSVNDAPTLYNNKLYLMCSAGGANNRGSILVFDPATNTTTTVYSFLATVGGNGFDPTGGLTLNGDFMYAVIKEYSNVRVIKFDPATNAVTTQSTHTPASNFNLPIARNGIAVLPAFIANGIENTCESYTPIAIDGTNNMNWVPILDNEGSIVAEIKANGNNLGNVNASLYIHDGAKRENAANNMYMDRNITISPQNPITGDSVDIRLYIKNTEYESLKSAQNSLGQPSDINSSADLAIYKNDQACPGNFINTTFQLATTIDSYEYGYVLKAKVTSFSSFFFAKNTVVPLPVNLLSFSGKSTEYGNLLTWQTANETDFSHFEIERSSPLAPGGGTSAQKFEKIGEVKGSSSEYYEFLDSSPTGDGGDRRFEALAGGYYRLLMVDLDGKFTYSKIIAIESKDSSTDFIISNPSKNGMFTILTSIKNPIFVVYSNQGQLINTDVKEINSGYYHLNLLNAPDGIYILKSGRQTKKIVKN